jgi:pyrroline-5-carboxylate reductase
MIDSTVVIIGVGNMGSAIARALLDKEIVSKSQLILCDPTSEKVAAFENEAQIIHNVASAVEKADIVLLAIKPQLFAQVLPEMKDAITSDKLILSIAAGVTVATIKQLLGEKMAIVRVMPNLAATVGESLSAWVVSPEVTTHQQTSIKILLQAIGEEFMVEKEDLLDAVTAISGSGPAYVFFLAELLQQNAQDLGIEKELAKKLARQTIIGSSSLLKQSDKSPEELRAAVTSKGGTTEAAFTILNSDEFKIMFANAIKKAHHRAKELSNLNK